MSTNPWRFWTPTEEGRERFLELAKIDLFQRLGVSTDGVRLQDLHVEITGPDYSVNTKLQFTWFIDSRTAVAYVPWGDLSRVMSESNPDREYEAVTMYDTLAKALIEKRGRFIRYAT